MESPHSISDDLIQQLDAANHRFTEAKQHLEEAIESSEYRHQERIDKRSEEFRAAEKALEEITARINEALKAAPEK